MQIHPVWKTSPDSEQFKQFTISVTFTDYDDLINLSKFFKRIGSVIEARLDKNKGPVATLLIQNGTLRLGDPLVIGTSFGKVRTLTDDTGKEILSAEPSKPVEVTGIDEVPVAGDKFMAFESEKEARNVALKRKENARNKKFAKKAVSLDDLFAQIQEGRKVGITCPTQSH